MTKNINYCKIDLNALFRLGIRFRMERQSIGEVSSDMTVFIFLSK